MNKEQVTKFLEDTEFDIQNAYAAALFIDLVFSSYAKSKKVHGVEFGPICSYFSFKRLKWFYQFVSKTQLDAVGDKIYSDYLKDHDSLKDKIHSHEDLTKQFDVVWKESLKYKDLKKAYKDLVEVSRRWWQYAAIGEDKGQVIDNHVVPNFEKRHDLSKSKAREIVFALSHPKEQTILNIERVKFLKICLYILNNKLKDSLKNRHFSVLLDDKELLDLINDYLKDFFWIKDTLYRGLNITEMFLGFVQEEFDKHSKSELSKELKKIESNFAKLHKDKEKILQTLKLTKQDKEDIHFSEQISYWIDHRKLGMVKSVHYFCFFFEEIAKKFKLSYHEVILYSVDEITHLLKTGKKVSKTEINKRDDGVFQVFEKDKLTRFYGKDGNDLFEIASHIEAKEIKGMTASLGKEDIVKGKVRIIKDPSKEKFEKGDILVTSMTRVEYVPLMRKAKAIITNEGGVACHAAIISRELGIPCIIGTKIATKVLKDGDEVEIDIKKGLVKVLK